MTMMMMMMLIKCLIIKYF